MNDQELQNWLKDGKIVLIGTQLELPVEPQGDPRETRSGFDWSTYRPDPCQARTTRECRICPLEVCFGPIRTQS